MFTGCPSGACLIHQFLSIIPAPYLSNGRGKAGVGNSGYIMGRRKEGEVRLVGKRRGKGVMVLVVGGVG